MASSSVSDSKVWEGIMHSEAAARCKNLAWRAYKEELPVKSMLLKRGVAEDDTCPCCGEGNETTTHALLLCEEVKRIWFASLGLRVELLHDVTLLSEWVDQCVGVLDKNEMGMVCTVLWALWLKRNAWVFTNRKLDCTQVMASASSMLIPNEWHPPSDPYVKANFGASVRENIGTGMGVVFRDSSGTLLASGTNFLDDECFEPEIAEALCFSWAMEQSGELGLSDVIFETDCQGLYTHWNQTQEKNSVSHSYLESLVEDCRIMIQGTGSTLALVRRTANEVAHSLATAAFDHGERLWVETLPHEASGYLQSDANKAIADNEIEHFFSL